MHSACACVRRCLPHCDGVIFFVSDCALVLEMQLLLLLLLLLSEEFRLCRFEL
jgi:hypothetical protein